MINRIELKQRAQLMIRQAPDPKPINVGMVFIAVSLILSMLSMRLMSGNVRQSDLIQIMEHVEKGNLEYAMAYLENYMPSRLAYLIDTALQMVSYIISAGFIIFILNTIRATSPCYENLLDGFAIWWKLIVLNLLTGLFVALWSLLLVVPGLIAAYSYRQAIYLLLDNPQARPINCLRESKKMMKGYKWDLFMLDLSFIGWRLLSVLSLIGWLVSIWTTPYFGFTYALYYDQLKSIYLGQTRDQGFYHQPNNGF